jgi:hypothetical protein
MMTPMVRCVIVPPYPVPGVLPLDTPTDVWYT